MEAAIEPRAGCGAHPGLCGASCGRVQPAAWSVVRGNHLSNTTCLTLVFFKSGE